MNIKFFIKKYLLKISIVIPFALSIPLASCSLLYGNHLFPPLFTPPPSSSNQPKIIDSTNYNFNKHSEITSKLAETTLSIAFSVRLTKYDSNYNFIKQDFAVQNGTGWFYKIDEKNNDFYIATNLHVANIISLSSVKNPIAVQSESSDTYEYVQYDLLFSFIRFIPLSISQDKNFDSSYVNYSNLNYVVVDNPTIVYSTTTDDDYNNEFKNISVYGKGFDVAVERFKDKDGNIFQKEKLLPQKYKPVTDIAVLKYSFPDDAKFYSNLRKQQFRKFGFNGFGQFNDASDENFVSWLKNAVKNQILIYDQPINNIIDSENKYKLYMGGFPAKSKNVGGNHIAEISFWGYSGFSIQNNNSPTTKNLQYSWNIYKVKNQQSNFVTPIPYWNKDSDLSNPSSYNFISSGRIGFLNANSFSGSSGSPIVTEINNKLYIIGIYFGSIQFSNNQTFGAANFFINEKYKPIEDNKKQDSNPAINVKNKSTSVFEKIIKDFIPGNKNNDESFNGNNYSFNIIKGINSAIKNKKNDLDFKPTKQQVSPNKPKVPLKPAPDNNEPFKNIEDLLKRFFEGF